jgi:peptidoglycan/LPS O-acetylase OafA/YrhL
MLGAAIYATGSVTCGVAVILAGLCEFAYTSSVLSRMGKYSLEVYLIHYTFLTYFYEEFSIDDPLLLFLIVATVSIMVSVIIKFVSDFILNRFNTAVSKVGNESCAGITPK